MKDARWRMDPEKAAPACGSVLILTLWVLFFLSALAVAIGGHVSSGIRLTSGLTGRNRCLAAARMEIERSLEMLVADTNAWDALTEPWAGTGDDFPAGGEFGEGTCLVRHSGESAATGLVVTNAGLLDEESRIAINEAEPLLLKYLFMETGGLGEDDATALADAVVDWRDEDDDKLTHGAETDYYANLAPAYACHNGPILVLEELLLVRGMDEALFARVAGFMTVYGSGAVNVNTAGGEVLRVIAMRCGGGREAVEDLVDKLLAFRDAGNVFEKAGEIAAVLGDYVDLKTGEPELLRAMSGFLKCSSAFFSGTAEGSVAGGTARIDFVINRGEGKQVFGYEY